MAHWDDLELLRLINDLEKEPSNPLWRGDEFFRYAAGERSSSEADRVDFARELLLARKAGYVEFVVRPAPTERPPELTEHRYLQLVEDIRLTLAGRDRALGREVRSPLPSADEDDGRAIAALTISRIASEIAATYSDRQLPMFLADSGLPSPKEVPIEGSEDRYLRTYFLELLNGGAAARRALREFLAAWLNDDLATGPAPDLKQELLVDLRRQGWHLGERALVVGERVKHQGAGRKWSVFESSTAAERGELPECFVILPLHEPFLSVYRNIVVPAARASGLTCGQAAEIFGPGSIVDDIYASIRDARVVVADLTGRNPNVFYELGLAHALGIPVVQLTQDMADVPFDVQHLRTVEYRWREEWAPAALDALRDDLSRHLTAAVSPGSP